MTTLEALSKPVHVDRKLRGEVVLMYILYSYILFTLYAMCPVAACDMKLAEMRAPTGPRG
jgi:hypothetical protein